jgi:hypothetical protein
VGDAQRAHPSRGKKRSNHPDIGPRDLVYHSLDLAADDDWVLDLTIHTAEPRTPSEDALKPPASLSATSDFARTAEEPTY